MELCTVMLPVLKISVFSVATSLHTILTWSILAIVVAARLRGFPTSTLSTSIGPVAEPKGMPGMQPVKSTSGSIYTISYCIYVAFRRLCTDAAHAARELQFSKVQKSGTAPYTMRPTWQGNSNSPKSKRPIPLHIRPFKSYSNLSIPLRNTVHRLLT